MYIPMFILFMVKEKDMGGFKRFVLPLLAICGSLFMVIAAIYAHGIAVAYYLIVFAAFMLAGVLFSKPKRMLEIVETESAAMDGGGGAIQETVADAAESPVQ